MQIAGMYSFKNGQEEVLKRYPTLFADVKDVIKAVDAAKHKIKVSKEKTMTGRMLFDPTSINIAFKTEFGKRSWKSVRIPCDYPTQYFLERYKVRSVNRGAFREMDFVKKKLGIEVQFGKYAFMVYNVCAKMTIFRNEGHIDTGIEIVPVKAFADEMSTGVSYFEQFVWDLDRRGVADIDVPVLILGIDS
jgi:Restriction endonuclease BglII